MGRVPGWAADPRGAGRRQPRPGLHRRHAARLRAGRGQGHLVCRPRATQAGQLGDPGAGHLRHPHAGRPQGQARRLPEGLQRALPGRARRGEGRPAMVGHLHARLSHANRTAARGLRARRARRLGHLGSVLRGGRDRRTRTRAVDRRRPHQQQQLPPRVACAHARHAHAQGLVRCAERGRCVGQVQPQRDRALPVGGERPRRCPRRDPLHRTPAPAGPDHAAEGLGHRRPAARRAADTFAHLRTYIPKPIRVADKRWRAWNVLRVSSSVNESLP